jgi:hypothetical protein
MGTIAVPEMAEKLHEHREDDNESNIDWSMMPGRWRREQFVEGWRQRSKLDFCKSLDGFLFEKNIIVLGKAALHQWLYSVMVSTSDSDSGNPSSIPGTT